MVTITDLKAMDKEAVLDFIRLRLGFSEDTQKDIRNHMRFEMSGYESETGECTLWNQSLVNRFADLGIYDSVSYLFLDFYKGQPTLYYQHWTSPLNKEMEMSGYTTSEIIYEILKATCLSDNGKRRRI